MWKQFVASLAVVGLPLWGVGQTPVNVYPPGNTAGGLSLNQSLPAVLGQATATPPASLVSTPSWGPNLRPTMVAAPTYLNAAPCATGCDKPDCAMPGCGDGASLSKPYVNLLGRQGTLGRGSCNTCDERQGGLLERLQAWLGFRRENGGAPHLVPHAYQAPLPAYFPCTPEAGGCTTAPYGPATPSLGSRFQLRTPQAGIPMPLTPLSANYYSSPTGPRIRLGDGGGTTRDAGSSVQRPNVFQRMLSFLTPEGFGYSSTTGGAVSTTGTCATGTCGSATPANGFGSNCTTGKVRYAQPMTAVNPAMNMLNGTVVPVQTQPMMAEPTMPLPAKPQVMPVGFTRPAKPTPPLVSTPLTNP